MLCFNLWIRKHWTIKEIEKCQNSKIFLAQYHALYVLENIYKYKFCKKKNYVPESNWAKKRKLKAFVIHFTFVLCTLLGKYILYNL